MMQKDISCGEDSDKAMQVVHKLWIRCPLCNHKTRTKVYPDTVLLNFPLYCPKCKRETIINVVQLKMVISKEPDA